ncbi:BBE domain-containing protein [Micromonospora sp. WMMD1120]|uniref:BBE domain-containing protein n=1 Tax=Micromonospora sp. WMMD1120 TaxID=3016106 RepID=UPI0024162A46|nr:BBE domain-containing protein [Micromonospora sp. WMMD1120]MDG4810354.1 BBE domain-containing protein [Micromonospora sp. WMMD1120]
MGPPGPALCAWGDVYAGFQIPNEDEPANWKFFSQFTREPFLAKAVSIVRGFMEKAPSPDSNFFTQAFGRGAQQQEPFGGSAFRNVPNIGTAEWETAYRGRSVPRLRRIKARYDPRNVFQYEQSIPPATV